QRQIAATRTFARSAGALTARRFDLSQETAGRGDCSAACPARFPSSEFRDQALRNRPTSNRLSCNIPQVHSRLRAALSPSSLASFLLRSAPDTGQLLAQLLH